MKVAILVILSFLYTQTSVAQIRDSDYITDSAFSIRYNELYIQSHTRDNRGYIMASDMLFRNYSRKKDTTGLINFSHRVLDQMPFTSLTKNGRRVRAPELYDNLANQAADTLSKIFERRENIDSALYYLSLSDTAYTYITGCGNDYYMHRIVNARRYANMYLAKGDTNAAMNALLKEALNRETNTHLQKLLLYLSAYNKQQLKNALNSAITGFRFEKYGDWANFYIIFMGVKIPFYFYEDYELTGPNNDRVKNSQRKKIIKFLKQYPFYKMVMAM